MRLSEITSDASLRVLRDGAFSSLGFVTHRREGLLVFLGDEAYVAAMLENPMVSCVLTTPEFVERIPTTLGVAVVTHAVESFYALHEFLVHRTTFYGVSRPSRIAPTARIHATAVVSPTDVDIEGEVEIGARVVVLPGVQIGNGSVIRAGTVLGSDGFQVLMANDAIRRVAHAGHVRIGERVDIHANSCVDRGLFSVTTVADDTTIDTLVSVSHEATVGARCRIGSHAFLGGSCRIGDGAWIGPSVAVSSGISIGPDARVTIGSVVTRDVPPGAHVTGNFAIEHDKYLAFLRSIR